MSLTPDPGGDLPASSGPAGAPADRRRWRALAVAVVLAILATALLFFLIHHRSGAEQDPQGSAPAAVTPTGYRLVVKSLNISAPIVGIDMTPQRALNPPANPREVGWWRASAKPGSVNGQTIVAGHTVHTGGGQFDHLGSIKKGAQIKIVRKKRIEIYVATKVVTLTKQQVSEQAKKLFGQHRTHNRLVLITCGNWTGREYLTNVFVYAKPVGAEPVGPDTAGGAA